MPVSRFPDGACLGVFPRAFLGGLGGLLGAAFGGGGGLAAGVCLDGVAEGAGLADAVLELIPGALGVFGGGEVFQAVGAVGVEDAGLAGGAEGDGAVLFEQVRQ